MLLELFRSFYIRQFPNDMEQQIELFALFGGLGWEFNVDEDLHSIIKNLILENYGTLYNQILDSTLDEPRYHRLLTAFARGDRRLLSAFKRARLSEVQGGDALRFLKDNGIISIEKSREAPPVRLYKGQQLKRSVARHRISHKVRFKTPFLRFWFYFIDPFHEEITAGHFDPVLEYFSQHQQSFYSFIFEELSALLLQREFEGSITQIGSYWDAHVEIDILAQDRSEHKIVGECKWTNHKVNKKELHKLHDKCLQAEIEPDITVFFSKRGFSKELTQMASTSLYLYEAKDFVDLLQDVKEHEKIKGFELPA